jgi:hypothetical protein
VGLGQGDHDLPSRLTFAQSDGDRYRILALLPAAGSYELTIFAGRGGEDYVSALQYRVEASEGVGQGVEFPQVYANFHQSGVALVEPLSGHLPTGQHSHFDLYVPGAERVALINGDTWQMLDRGGEDRFTGDMSPQAGKVLVAAQLPGQGGFAGLVSYDVP